MLANARKDNSSSLNWLQHRVYTINDTRFVSKLNYFRPRVSANLGKMSFKFSAPKIWETVALGLKCLPHHKFKKEYKSQESPIF